MARGNPKPLPQFSDGDTDAQLRMKLRVLVRDLELLIPTAGQIPPENARFIYSGTGAPAAALGDNGDFYFDDDAGEFYRKESGAWVSVGTLNTA